MCKHITETDTFTNTVTGETFKINYRCECNGKCLIYLLTWNNSTLVKQEDTFVVDGTATSLKVEVSIEEKSVCKSICRNILKKKLIQVSLAMFL